MNGKLSERRVEVLKTGCPGCFGMLMESMERIFDVSYIDQCCGCSVQLSRPQHLSGVQFDHSQPFLSHSPNIANFSPVASPFGLQAEGHHAA